MAEIPEAALAAGAEAVNEVYAKRGWNKPAPWWVKEVSAAVLEAAAPLLAEATLTPLAKRHAMIPGEWGGGYCGTCWIKGGSRAAWPCGEILAIAEILPGRAENVSASSAATGEDGEP